MINAAESVSPSLPLVFMNTVLKNIINIHNKKVGYKNGLLFSAQGFISDRIIMQNIGQKSIDTLAI